MHLFNVVTISENSVQGIPGELFGVYINTCLAIEGVQPKHDRNVRLAKVAINNFTIQEKG